MSWLFGLGISMSWFFSLGISMSWLFVLRKNALELRCRGLFVSVTQCRGFLVLESRCSDRPQPCNFIKKETLAQMSSCEFCEISKNTFFTEHLWTTGSVVHLYSWWIHVKVSRRKLIQYFTDSYHTRCKIWRKIMPKQNSPEFH